MIDCSGEALLKRALELQDISQTGLRYATCDFDLQRYSRLRVIATELLACFTETPIETIQDYLWPQEGYPTPKVEVRIGVVNNGKVLLVQERDDQRWALPGGWADSWLTPTENARKELQEETGFTVGSLELIGLLDSRRCVPITKTPAHAYTLLFRGREPDGVFKHNIETLSADWFALENIPPLSAHRTSPNDIHLVLSNSDHVTLM